MTGTEIVEDAMNGSSTVGFVGRVGGAAGARFAADVESGTWHTQKYQVRATAVDATNRNWMPVAAFLAAVGARAANEGGPAGGERGAFAPSSTPAARVSSRSWVGGLRLSGVG